MQRYSVLIALLAAVLVSASTGAMAQNSISFLNVGMKPPQLEYMESVIIPEYEAKFKTKVDVITTDWGGRMEKITVLHAGGMAPDVLITGYYSPWEEGSRGMLAPLDRYANSWSNLRKYPKPLIDALRWNGQLMVIPNDVDLRIYVYNKELFAASGFDPEMTPQSWEEQLQYTQRLTRMQDANRVAVRGMDVLRNAHMYGSLVRQAGVALVNFDTFKSNLNTPEALSAMEYFQELWEAAKMGMSAAGNFYSGHAAMLFGNATIIYELQKTNPDVLAQLGGFSPKRYPDSDPVAYTFINGLAISSASKNKDMAWELIALMNNDTHVIKWQELGGRIAGRVDLVREMMRMQPRVELWYEQFDYLQPHITPPPRDVAQTLIDNLMKQVSEMRVTPKAALEQAHTTWQLLLNEWQEELRGNR